MKLQIDTNSRLFVLNADGYFSGNQFPCNLEHLPEIIEQMQSEGRNVTIRELWNGKLTKCSKKHLNEMFKAHRIEYKFV